MNRTISNQDETTRFPQSFSFFSKEYIAGIGLALAVLSFANLDIATISGTANVYTSFWVKWLSLSLVSIGFGCFLLFRATYHFEITIGDVICFCVISLVFGYALIGHDKPNARTIVAYSIILACLLLFLRFPDRSSFKQTLDGFSGSSFIGLSILALSTKLGLLPQQIFLGFGNENYLMQFSILTALLSADRAFQNRSIIWCLVSLGTLIIGLSFSNSLSWLLLCPAAICLLAFLPKMQKWFLLIMVLVLSGVTAYFIMAELTFDQIIQGLPDAVRHRFQIWLASLHLFLDQENIWMGSGAGTFSYLFGNHSLTYLDSLPALGMPVHEHYFFPGRAHNEWIQILLEFGVFGLVFCTLLFLMIARIIYKEHLAANRPFIVMAAVFLFFLSLISFPFQRPDTLVISVLLLGLFFQHQKPTLSFPLNRRRIAPFSAITIFAGLIGVGLGSQLVMSHAHYTQSVWANHYMEGSARVVNIADQLQRAVDYWPLDEPASGLYQNRVAEVLEAGIEPHQGKLSEAWKITNQMSPWVPNALTGRILMQLNGKTNPLTEAEMIALFTHLKDVNGRLHKTPFALEALYWTRKGQHSRVPALLKEAEDKPFSNEQVNLLLRQLKQVKN